MRTNEEARYEFTPQGKLDAGGTQRLLNLEVAFKDMAMTVLEMAPETASRTIALNHLLMAKMMCAQAVSHPEAQSNKESASEKAAKKSK